MLASTIDLSLTPIPGPMLISSFTLKPNNKRNMRNKRGERDGKNRKTGYGGKTRL